MDDLEFSYNLGAQLKIDVDEAKRKTEEQKAQKKRENETEFQALQAAMQTKEKVEEMTHQ